MYETRRRFTPNSSLVFHAEPSDDARHGPDTEVHKKPALSDYF